MGARKCNIIRYLIWVNKRLLWITRQQYWWSQDLPSAIALMGNVFSELESFKLPCCLPISANYHLNNLSRLSGIIHKFALFHVTGCLFSRKSRKSVPHCSCMNFCFINKLIRIRFIPFWMNIITEKLYKTAFLYFYNSFQERLLSVTIRKRFLFLDLATTQYLTKIV